MNLTITYIGIGLAVGIFITWIYFSQRIKKISSFIKLQKPLPKTTRGALRELKQKVTHWSAERKEESDLLQKLENYRREFLGNVFHELKTPIFNIQGYIHTLLDGGMDDKAIVTDYLKKAGRSVDRMIAIVEDLQTITQLEKGELELDWEDFDIVALCKDVLDAQELKAKENKITLILLNNPDEPIWVHADKFRIRQVLVNLVVNSVRYGKPNGETKVKVSEIENKVVVEVADNGIGISEEHLPRIFERFYRADKSRSREMGGTGLGLSIVKHIMEAHNEKVDVKSTKGVGSVFWFTLKKSQIQYGKD